MNYLQRLWRAEIIGLVSLAAVSFPIAIVLVFFFDLGSSAPTGLRGLLAVFLGTYSVGFTPVVTYGAPIFAAYMLNLRSRLIYLLGFAKSSNCCPIEGIHSDQLQLVIGPI